MKTFGFSNKVLGLSKLDVKYYDLGTVILYSKTIHDYKSIPTSYELQSLKCVSHEIQRSFMIYEYCSHFLYSLY